MHFRTLCMSFMCVLCGSGMISLPVTPTTAVSRPRIPVPQEAAPAEGGTNLALAGGGAVAVAAAGGVALSRNTNGAPA